jgi:hypothetical protein
MQILRRAMQLFSVELHFCYTAARRDCRVSAWACCFGDDSYLRVISFKETACVFFCTVGNYPISSSHVFTDLYRTNKGKNKKFWEELIAYFSLYDTGHIENDASNISSIVACVFVTAVNFLPSHCLATIRDFYPAVV